MAEVNVVDVAAGAVAQDTDERRILTVRAEQRSDLIVGLRVGGRVIWGATARVLDQLLQLWPRE